MRRARPLRLAIDRARDELGRQPRWRLEEALLRSARGYRAVERNPSAARDECLSTFERTHSEPVDESS